VNKLELATRIAALVIVAASPLISQSPSTPLSFEAVSVKLISRDAGPLASAPGGNKYFTRAPLRGLLRLAYLRSTPGAPMDSLREPEIISAPKWIDTDIWEVQAIMDCSGGPYSFEQLQQMVQSMLEERFKLKAHMETREVPVYNLVVGKDGPKIKPSADQTPTRLSRSAASTRYCGSGPAESVLLPGPPPGQRATLTIRDPELILPRGTLMTQFRTTGRVIRGEAVSLASLIGIIQVYLGRPVVDKTNLNGLFDFILQFPQEVAANPDSSSPYADTSIGSTLTAVQQLGLKLEASKGPINALVIDSVEKPKGN